MSSLFKRMLSIAALAIGLNALSQDAEVPAVQPQAPAKFDVTELLKMIPDKLASYGDGKFVMGEEIRNIITFQLDMAAKQGQEVTKEDVEMIIPRMAEGYVQQVIVGIEAEAQGLKPDVDKVKKQLDALVNQPQGKDTLAQILKQFNCKDVDEFAMKQAKMLMAQELIKKQIETIEVSDEEAKKEYEDNKEAFSSLSAAHILISPTDKPGEKATKEQEDAALAKIKDIQKQLNDGAKFEELAKEHSACPSGKQGGNLGEFRKGQMVPEFEDALLKLKAGEVSDVVKTQFGYHLIKAGEAKTRSFDDMKPQIVARLKQEKQGEVVMTYVDGLMKKYNVKMLVKEAGE
jgi:parvulin-like peptidyl-prolyl isomerase